MKIFHKNIATAGGIICTLLWLGVATVNLAEARVGGGRSSGSRGSHSMSSPRPAFTPPPPSPSRPQTPPSSGLTAPGPQQTRPGMGLPPPSPQPAGGGFLRNVAGGLAGGLVGGMIGNMFFGGSGHAGPGGGAPAAGGGGCSSIGLFDIILIGGLLYLGYRLLNRRQEALETGSAGGSPVTIPTSWKPAEPEPIQLPAYDVQAELAAIAQKDPTFTEASFKEKAQDVFFKLQGAWMRQDPALLKDLATPELGAVLEKDLQDMKAKGQINKLENIAVRQVEISEAWQEQGHDYITVGFLANLLDYTVDANTNLVIAGSDSEPVKFEEYWTFSRPTGSGPWKLSAITQPEG